MAYVAHLKRGALLYWISYTQGYALCKVWYWFREIAVSLHVIYNNGSASTVVRGVSIQLPGQSLHRILIVVPY